MQAGLKITSSTPKSQSVDAVLLPVIRVDCSPLKVLTFTIGRAFKSGSFFGSACVHLFRYDSWFNHAVADARVSRVANPWRELREALTVLLLNTVHGGRMPNHSVRESEKLVSSIPLA